MLTLKLLDKNGEIIAKRSHETETYLAFKTRAYNDGDFIEVEVDNPNTFIWVQVDEAIEPSLIYLKETIWRYNVITDPELRRAYTPKIFSGERHYIRVYQATDEEISEYRNLARNAHDQKEASNAYPHAYANVETRNDSTFFARNAIDGMIANEDHGSFPYQSWGINQQADAQITIDFGRLVEIDKVALVLRGDYPHDSFWTQVTLEFSDGSSVKLNTTNQMDRQYFTFDKIVTSSVTLKELIKHEDESPFPALTEFEAFGVEYLK